MGFDDSYLVYEGYPKLPFHPTDLGNAACEAVLGFAHEGSRHDGFDPAEVSMGVYEKA